MSGVWTTGGCEEESAGAVEVVNFSFFFFFFFVFLDGIRGICGVGNDDFFGFYKGRREGLVGWGVFFFFLGREKRRKGVVDIYPFE